MIRHEEFDYSAKEHILIDHYGYQEIAPMISPLGLYRLMVQKAFIANEQNHFAESLRRCMEAWDAGVIYRMSEEWDALIHE